MGTVTLTYDQLYKLLNAYGLHQAAQEKVYKEFCELVYEEFCELEDQIMDENPDFAVWIGSPTHTLPPIRRHPYRSYPSRNKEY